MQADAADQLHECCRRKERHHQRPVRDAQDSQEEVTEPRGVVGFEVTLGAYASLLSMAATDSVLLVS